MNSQFDEALNPPKPVNCGCRTGHFRQMTEDEKKTALDWLRQQRKKLATDPLKDLDFQVTLLNFCDMGLLTCLEQLHESPANSLQKEKLELRLEERDETLQKIFLRLQTLYDEDIIVADPIRHIPLFS